MEECFLKYKFRGEMLEKAMRDPAIGVDLGTTMCCVTVYYNGKVEVIPNRTPGNSRTTPSYVAYPYDDECDTYGSVAKDDAYRCPETTFYDAKRMIGRPWTDKTIQDDMKRWPFSVVNADGHPKLKTWKLTKYPHEISARLLTQFRIMADEHLNLPIGTVKKGVITVPAYFTERQRRATSEAGQCAGLEVPIILSEPTAAAIAYSWERRVLPQERRIAMIYDHGGGTFDVAVAAVEAKRVEILAVDGDTHLRGQDFDHLLMNYCVEEFLKTEGVNLLETEDSPNAPIMVGIMSMLNPFMSAWQENVSVKPYRVEVKSALARLKFQCEKTKEKLSCSKKQVISVERIYKDKHLALPITKEIFEELIKPLVRKTLGIVDRLLQEVKSKGIKGKSDIDDVILIGGSTRVPLVAQLVSDHFDGKHMCKSINPDEAVAYGAAVQAAILNNDDRIGQIMVQYVSPMTLGMVAGSMFSKVIPRNSKIPCHFYQGIR